VLLLLLPVRYSATGLGLAVVLNESTSLSCIIRAYVCLFACMGMKKTGLKHTPRRMEVDLLTCVANGVLCCFNAISTPFERHLNAIRTLI